MKDEKKYPLFSNGTQFEIWASHNCEQCIKGVFYNEKTDTWPKYRCAIQKHIDEAFIGDGMGNKRDHEACNSYNCPYKRKDWPKKHKKDKDKSLTLCF